MLIELESYFGAIHPALGSVPGFLIRFPFLQALSLGFALGFGALYFVVPENKICKYFYLTLALAVNAYAALDQIAYRVFLSHYVPSMNLGATQLHYFVDSCLAEIDLVTLVNVAVLTGLGVFLTRQLRNPRPLVVAPTWGYWLVHYVLLAIIISSGTETFGLDEPPLLALVRDFSHQPQAVKLRDARLAHEIFQLKYGHFAESEAQAKALADYLRARATRKRAPNLIFVVMESVGAKVLLEESGGFSRELTPFLHSYESHAIVFDSLYGIYPATTRAHQAINTGGFAMTWGGLDDGLECKFVGPTLAGEMHRAGYTTALFSAAALEPERLGTLYKSVASFDKFYDFGLAPYSYQTSHRVHSWGGDEEGVNDEIFEWLDGSGRPGVERPFFLQLLTVSTHHPYATAHSYKHSFDDDTAWNRYRNSVSYTDFALRKLVEGLLSRGLLDDTVIVLTGDHGEAFGQYHAGNVLHGNGLYEENIRNFMVVLDPGFKAGPLLSHRPASSGDLQPTLAALAQARGNTALGQNLFAASFEPRAQYFFKAFPPQKWGLRDGQWKFVGGITDKGAPELYDLAVDPEEGVNLATKYPDRIKIYDQNCARWFAGMTPEYVRRLEGCHRMIESDEGVAEAGRQGPKSLTIGRARSGGTLEGVARANPNEALVAWITWQSYTEFHRIGFHPVARAALNYLYLMSKSLVSAWTSTSCCRLRKVSGTWWSWIITAVPRASCCEAAC